MLTAKLCSVSCSQLKFSLVLRQIRTALSMINFVKKIKFVFNRGALLFHCHSIMHLCFKLSSLLQPDQQAHRNIDPNPLFHRATCTLTGFQFISASNYLVGNCHIVSAAFSCKAYRIAGFSVPSHSSTWSLAWDNMVGHDFVPRTRTSIAQYSSAFGTIYISLLNTFVLYCLVSSAGTYKLPSLSARTLVGLFYLIALIKYNFSN